MAKEQTHHEDPIYSTLAGAALASQAACLRLLMSADVAQAPASTPPSILHCMRVLDEALHAADDLALIHENTLALMAES